MKRETTEAYLIRNGWVQVKIFNGKPVLWKHDDPSLAELDGFPLFQPEAVDKQRARDRREA